MRTEAGTAWWLATGLAAVCAYAYALNGLYIPHIGDEAPYIEIARLTSESGQWLPLRTGPGLENTKPPLLYWLGIVSTDLMGAFSLLALRLPIVGFTLASATLSFFGARKLGYRPQTAGVAAFTFLGFFGSFQYGRPFLTNMPETFFVFLSFVLALPGNTKWGYPRAVAVGGALGIACLFKSFALVAPAGLGLAAAAWVGRDGDWKEWVLHDGPRLVVVGLVALSCFALWPLLDPEPYEVLRHFVVEENLGKLSESGGGYLRGLFAGPYPLYRIWLGPLWNAGLLAFPLLFVVVADLRAVRRLGSSELKLWAFVLAFLVVYSLPSQRQENYLLPVMPALAILLARRWATIPAPWLRLASIPGLLAAGGLVFAIAWVGRATPLPEDLYPGWYAAVPAVALAGWLVAIARPTFAREGFHALVLATLLSIGCATAPFEGPAGRFDPARVARLRGRQVYVPESFIRRHERHRFLLPGAIIEPYDPLDTSRLAQLLERGRIVVVHRSLGESETGPFRVLARRLDLRSRQTPEEMVRIVLRREIDLLVRQELVVRRFRAERDREDRERR